jgi:hypothetical protein
MKPKGRLPPETSIEDIRNASGKVEFPRAKAYFAQLSEYPAFVLDLKP